VQLALDPERDHERVPVLERPRRLEAGFALDEHERRSVAAESVLVPLLGRGDDHGALRSLGSPPAVALLLIAADDDGECRPWMRVPPDRPRRNGRFAHLERADPVTPVLTGAAVDRNRHPVP
jgi:hypothetical protein